MKTPMRLGAATMLGATLFLGVGACSSSTEPTTPSPTTSSAVTKTPQEVETIALSEHGILVGNPKAAKKVQIAIDQQCPHCRDFSKEVENKLTEAINAGDVQVEYFVTDFLKEKGYGGWSTTAANALNVVAASSTDAGRWKDVYMALYEAQPTSENEVLSSDEVIKVIQNTGVQLTDDEKKQIEENSYADKIAGDTNYVFDLGITGSPTVLIDDVPQPALSDPEIFMEYLKTGEVPVDPTATS